MFFFTDSLNSCNEDFESYRDVHAYIDIIAMLLVSNVKGVEGKKVSKEDMNILQVIAHTIPEFFKYFRVSDYNFIPTTQSSLLYINLFLFLILGNVNK